MDNFTKRTVLIASLLIFFAMLFVICLPAIYVTLYIVIAIVVYCICLRSSADY